MTARAGPLGPLSSFAPLASFAPIASAAWPAERLVEAVETLARRARVAPPSAGAGPRPTALGGPPRDREAAGRRVEAMAAWLGLEAEPVDVFHADVAWLVRAAPPAVIELPGGTRERTSRPRAAAAGTGSPASRPTAASGSSMRARSPPRSARRSRRRSPRASIACSTRPG